MANASVTDREDVVQEAERCLRRLEMRQRESNMVLPRTVFPQLREKIAAVTAHLAATKLPPGLRRLLPVVTPRFVPTEQGLAYLMSGVMHGRNGGYSHIDDFSDIVDVPAEDAYWMIGVDDGEGFFTVAPLIAAARIVAQKRSPLTLSEAIALCIHTDALLKHDVCAPGSATGDRGGSVPLLYVPDDNQQAINFAPELTMHPAARGYPGLAVPSCVHRI